MKRTKVNPKSPSFPVLLLLLLCVSTGATSCATVPVYQRSTLQSRVMKKPRAADEAVFDSHVHATREAMKGATEAGSASCGCN